MAYSYIYNGKTYTTERALRNAVWVQEHKAFGTIPADTADTFLAELNISLQENQQSLEQSIARKLQQLDDAFLEQRDFTATFKSSLGFYVDADSRAMQDITGLWLLAAQDPDYTTTFVDARNNTHSLSVGDILTLAKEITHASQNLYQQKWELRALIAGCATQEDLDAIEISFTTPNYCEV